MPLLRRATDQAQSDFVPLPEGLWRFVIGKPEMKLSEKYNNYQVRFPLLLTPDEVHRLNDEFDSPPEGMQQSTRASYFAGLSLGYIQRDGQYKTTKLIDFLSAALGQGQTRKFREWIAGGGGPPRPNDLDDQRAELTAIEEWLGWWEGLEVLGTIRHQENKESGQVFANYAGPMAVGSLPRQPDAEYDAHGRGKLRSIIAASGEQREDHSRQARGIPTGRPAQRFTADGNEVTDDDIPF